MRRTLIGLVTISILLLATAPALADKPEKFCPSSASGWERVDGEGWWAATVAGIETEGLTVESEAELYGFDDLDEFKKWVIDSVFDVVDVNNNDHICMKHFPNTPGLPAYMFNAVDDNSAARR